MHTIENVIYIVANTTSSYPAEAFEKAVNWWIENADSSNSRFEELVQYISDHFPHIINSYKWESRHTKQMYRTEREYQTLYINSNPTKQIKYAGRSKPNFNRYAKYFNMSFVSVKKEISSLEYFTGWLGAFWYMTDDRRQLGFDTNEICCSAFVPLIDIYPCINTVADSNGVLSREAFESYVQKSAEYVFFEEEFSLPFLSYSYNNLYVWVFVIQTVI